MELTVFADLEDDHSPRGVQSAVPPLHLSGDWQVERAGSLMVWAKADGSSVYDIAIDRQSVVIHLRPGTLHEAEFALARFVRSYGKHLAHSRSTGRVLIHGAAVVVGDSGIVIMRPTRAGKTTTLLSLLATGEADFVSNSSVTVSREATMYGWPQAVGVRREMARVFPQFVSGTEFVTPKYPFHADPNATPEAAGKLKFLPAELVELFQVNARPRARVQRAGGGDAVIVRADSGFYRHDLLQRLSRAGVGFSVTIHQRQPVRAAIDQIPERAWQRIDYPDDAHVAECVYRGRRLMVRRVRNHQGPQGQLFATWRYHAFVTNLAGSAWALDRQHRAHAVIELSIRDLKAGPLAHLPSGSFHANSAWLQCAVLAHNLLRWTATLAHTHTDQLVVAKTFRHRLLTIPGRLVNHSGRPTLRLPARWPWAEPFLTALDSLRALPPVPG